MQARQIKRNMYLPLKSTSNQQAKPCTLVPTEAMNLRGISISYSSSSYNIKSDLVSGKKFIDNFTASIERIQ